MRIRARLDQGACIDKCQPSKFCGFWDIPFHGTVFLQNAASVSHMLTGALSITLLTDSKESSASLWGFLGKIVIYVPLSNENT